MAIIHNNSDEIICTIENLLKMDFFRENFSKNLKNSLNNSKINTEFLCFILELIDENNNHVFVDIIF